MLSELFAIHVSPWELILRGTLTYWFLFLLFRFVLRRDAGTIGVADLLMVVVIADAAQNGMAGEYRTVSEGFVLIATLGCWNYFIDWMSFHFRWFEKFAQPGATPLIRHGRLLRGNMQKELLSEEDLMSQLREKGIEHYREVKLAALETDGKISVVSYKGKG